MPVDVPVPAEQWDGKLQLALEQEMLGLSVFGHPLHGVEHILARQSDIPTGEPPRRAVGIRALLGATRRPSGKFLRRRMNHRDTSDSFTSDA